MYVLSKVFGCVYVQQVNRFYGKAQVLFEYHSSYIRYMAVMVLVDKIIKCRENREYLIGVCLDFSKAFDTVEHEILF